MPAFNPRGSSFNNKTNDAQPVGGAAMRLSSREKPEPPGKCERNCEALKEMFLVPLNLMLVFVPLGVASGWLEWPHIYSFSLNFLAIIPLAGVLGAATDALSAHTGQMVGGLLNATFGNAVEMLVTISALKAGLVGVVQDSLIGSILSNLLLVLGMAFICSGYIAKETSFNITGASANVTCLVLASMSMTMPTVFSYIEGTTPEQGIALSRICACVLTFIYVLFLIFQLKTHAELFIGEDEEEEEQPMSLGVAMVILFGATCTVAMNSEFLVQSIEGVSGDYKIPKAFIGMILLPIVGNAAEHSTAVTAAIKGKMDLALGVAVGSATQIALFVVPFSVIVGWCVDVPMTLDFQIFSTTVFLLSVFIASSVLNDGQANWFEGSMLCASYCLVAIICWYIPERKELVNYESAKATERLLSTMSGWPQQPLI